MASQPDIASDRRESLRCDFELPLSWCPLEGLVNASALATRLGLDSWYARQRVLEDMDDTLRHEIAQVQDPHASAALRLMEATLRRLAEPLGSEQSIGELTPVNLSIDGVSFAVPATGQIVEPRSWLGIALLLPDNTPLLACLEVVWVGEADQMLHIGGRFHHVVDGCAKKLARTLLIGSPRGTSQLH